MDTADQGQIDSVEQLVELARKKFGISEEKTMEYIINLSNRKMLTFRRSFYPSSMRNYLFSRKATWFWAVTTFAFLSLVTTFMIPENYFPQVYIRYFFGSIFLLWLPGFCLMKALFLGRELDYVEMIVLSIGTSLALVPLTAFLLNFTHWGITAVTLSASIFPMVLFFATVGIIREIRAYLK